MSIFFQNLLEFFAWCRIVASPLFIGFAVSSFVYFPNPSDTRLLIAFGISFAGLAIGILWANSIKQKNGTFRFISSINGSPDLDDFQEKMKMEDLKKRSLIVKTKNKNTKHHSTKTFEELYSDLGVFQYSHDGFSITYDKFQKQFKWDEIIQINVFKRDQLTVDLIEMEIVSIKSSFTISEDLPGWYQFILKTKEVFPSIPKDWDITIIQKPFHTNFTTIYRKNDKFEHPY
jgi:hypothetical protein